MEDGGKQFYKYVLSLKKKEPVPKREYEKRPKFAQEHYDKELGKFSDPEKDKLKSGLHRARVADMTQKLASIDKQMPGYAEFIWLFFVEKNGRYHLPKEHMDAFELATEILLEGRKPTEAELKQMPQKVRDKLEGNGAQKTGNKPNDTPHQDGLTKPQASFRKQKMGKEIGERIKKTEAYAMLVCATQGFLQTEAGQGYALDIANIAFTTEGDIYAPLTKNNNDFFVLMTPKGIVKIPKKPTKEKAKKLKDLTVLPTPTVPLVEFQQIKRTEGFVDKFNTTLVQTIREKSPKTGKEAVKIAHSVHFDVMRDCLKSIPITRPEDALSKALVEGVSSYEKAVA